MQQLSLIQTDELKLLIKEASRESVEELFQKFLGEYRNKFGPKEKPPINYKTRHEIAKDLRISLVTLHQHTLNGLPSIKIGKRRLYDPVQVQKYFELINAK